ncbi:TnsA endonuclease N-terminal domain-containing protein [Sphingopyxis chilensis]|uniref:TnsA endonuclease N-terminal domain-containing protein n=1 Tax=Sphingopyxis chilensis TaxID=180400 RepID=UPI002DDC9761|nr:TnsA endonuclease N-terminal domain-containing protein [Sphingopyxis chilensis]
MVSDYRDHYGIAIRDISLFEKFSLSLSLSLADTQIEDVRVVRRQGGGHVRISNGRRARAMGRYFSVKMGNLLPWESRLELRDLYRCEVDPKITSYFVQPETMHWRCAGKARRYTPDRIDHVAGGQRRVIEIKDSFDPKADTDYTEKLEQASQIYAALGHNFEIRERSAILNEPSFSAIEEIQAYRRTAITPVDITTVHHALRSESKPLSDILSMMNGAHPKATLFAMAVRRFVNIDVTNGLHDGAAVSLLEANSP